MSLRILSVVSEIFPLIKTGGLADVAGALPLALAAEDVAVSTLVPGYPTVMDAVPEAELVHCFPDLLGGPVQLLRAVVGGLDLLVVDAPHLYDRPGRSPYLDPLGQDWPDNAERYAVLSMVAAFLGEGHIPALRPDIVHAHDWQAGLACAYLRYSQGPRPKLLFTIHNLAFHGRFDPGLLPRLGLPASSYAVAGLEFHGQASAMKAGLWYADHISTVSPTYAAEIRGVDGGMGFDGLLRARSASLTGILNGIDSTVWNPATDRLIASRYDAARLRARQPNKAALQKLFGVEQAPDRLLFALVSRLSWQKGADLLLQALPTALAQGAQCVLLGNGDAELEEACRQAAAQYPGQVGCIVGYDEELAHLLQAGADAVLVPSRFEPCGLTQLCAQRYGALPIVTHTGGLADTVIDANEVALGLGLGTGLVFGAATVPMLEATLLRALHLWNQPRVWRQLQRNAMGLDLSWRQPAKRYAELYRTMAQQPAA